jgi:hypothetical protein
MAKTDDNTVLYLMLGVVVFFLFMRRMNSQTKEGFRPGEQCRTKYFNTYKDHIPYPEDGSLDATADIKDMLIDTKSCHPSCCGKQWPVPFDNLDSNQITKCIAGTNKNGNTFVQTPYRCSYGATGCPCVDKRAYKNLATRGGNNGPLESVRIPPTWEITDKEVYDYNSGYYQTFGEQLGERVAPYTSARNVTDNSEIPTTTNVRDVMGWPTPISAPSKEHQLEHLQ